MASLTEFFNITANENLKGITHKNNIIKRNIIAYMAVNGECTLSELTKELHISVPTITKLVQELIEENIVNDLGKVETPGGRRPNVFGLANSAIYFAGVNVARDNMTFVITDLQNNLIKEVTDNTFELQNRPQCLEKICSNIEHFIDTCGIDRSKILGLGVSIVGRVNPETGRSYMYFTSNEESLRDIIQKRINMRVLLENDTRARCYAEYNCSRSKEESDVIYLHLGRGVAIGIVIDGKLYYGKNGFAGEFGHIPFFDNEKICACGKKGCLETEVSGIAIEEKIIQLIKSGVNTILREKYDRGEQIHINDIIAAAKPVGAVLLAALDLGDTPADEARSIADELKARRGDLVAVLATRREGGLQFLAVAGKDAVAAGAHAGRLVGAVAAVAGGKGGGRPDNAMAGGRDAGKVADALAAASGALEELLK